jgi:DNA-binding transcriptional MerR regulator
VQPQTPAAAFEQVPRPPPDAAAVPAPIAPPAADDRIEATRLNVAAAARRFGVAPSTLRTWARRYGIGPTDHTPGRHRRYSPDDIARLELMQRSLILGATPADAAAHALSTLPTRPHTAPPAEDASTSAGSGGRPPAIGGGGDPLRVRTGGAALRLPGAGWRARGLGRAVLALDADTVRGLLAESIAEDGVQATWDDVTRPVLAAVAQRWADTGEGIEIEHLLSDCVTAVFGAVTAGTEPAVTARSVLLAGMAGDQHGLPLVVLAATLTLRGVSCRSLGTDLPQAALATAIRRTAPAAVLLWSQLGAGADPRAVRSLPRTRPGYRVFVAGPGWAEVELPSQIGRLESLGEATDALSAASAGHDR